MSADLRELWNHAKAFAISRKVQPELAEEFAQELVLERAMGGLSAYRLDWKLTDFLRKEHGATRVDRDGRPRSRAGQTRAAQTSLDAPVPGTDGGLRLGDTIAAPAPDESPLPEAMARAPLTAAEERVLEEFADGVDGRELAAVFGVSDSRISQVYRSAVRKLRDAAVMEELLDEYMRDPERSKLEVSWL